MTYNVFGGTLNPAQSNPVMVIWLGRGADLHVAQLMPMTLCLAPVNTD